MPQRSAQQLPFGLHRLRHLPHHRSRALVWILDQLFHFIGWIWGSVILGGVVVNVLLSYVQYGSSGPSDPSKYVLVALALQYPVVSLISAGVLVLVTVFGAIAHYTVAHEEPRDELSTIPVRQIDLHDLRFKLGSDPSPTYFARPVFDQASELLGKAAAGSAHGRFGLIIFGIPMVGKSRLALQCLQRVVPQFELLVWPHL